MKDGNFPNPHLVSDPWAPKAGGRVSRSREIRGALPPGNYDISAAFFLDTYKNVARTNLFKLKWPKSEEKMNFGGRLVWVPMNPSPQNNASWRRPCSDHTKPIFKGNNESDQDTFYDQAYCIITFRSCLRSRHLTTPYCRTPLSPHHFSTTCLWCLGNTFSRRMLLAPCFAAGRCYPPCEV